MFDKYPDTEQFRNVIREVQDRHQYECHVDGVPQYDRSLKLPTLKFRGTVKLHGTNAGIVFTKTPNGFEVEAQSRSRVITPENDNMGFAKWVADNEEQLKKVVSEYAQSIGGLALNEKQIVFYGEWAGQGIQNGVAISQTPRKFWVFAIKVGETWMQNVSVLLDYVYQKDIEMLPITSFGDLYEIDIDFNRPEIAQAELVRLTQAVEDCCPIGKALGVEGVGEGIVWVNLDDPTRPLRFKVKGEKHSTSKVKTLADVDVAKVESAVKFADYAATENRVKQAVQELTGGEPFDIKLMGDVIKWVAADIIKEESDVLAENGLTMKDVGKYTGQRTREIFLGMI